MKSFGGKLKEVIYKYRKEIIFFLLMFLVASLSFGLGYLSNQTFNRSPIIIQKYSS